VHDGLRLPARPLQILEQEEIRSRLGRSYDWGDAVAAPPARTPSLTRAWTATDHICGAPNTTHIARPSKTTTSVGAVHPRPYRLAGHEKLSGDTDHELEVHANFGAARMLRCACDHSYRYSACRQLTAFLP
jgi:hypothetical protein